jgi:hypothetical protein
VENETTNFYVLQDETGDPAAMVMNGRKLNQFQFLEEACRAARHDMSYAWQLMHFVSRVFNVSGDRIFARSCASALRYIHSLELKGGG